MASAAQEANSALNSIKTTAESYDTVVEKLKEWKVGTEEWKNTLAEVNDLVLNLL